MGRLGVIHRKGGQRNIWWFEAIFRLWWAQKHPHGFPMVPNGYPSVTWEFKINILLCDDFTMGKQDVTYLKGGQQNIWLFKAFFGRFQALRGPQGPLRFPKGFQWMTQCGVWYDFTKEKLDFAHLKGGLRNIWWFGSFWLLPGTEGALKSPQGFLTIMGHCLKAMATLFCPCSKCSKWENGKIQQF